MSDHSFKKTHCDEELRTAATASKEQRPHAISHVSELGG